MDIISKINNVNFTGTQGSIILDDGGLILLSENKPSILNSTIQSTELYAKLIGDENDKYLDEIELLSNKLDISDSQFFDYSDYHWGTLYILSDGSIAFADDIGISYFKDMNKFNEAKTQNVNIVDGEVEYYDFQDFCNKFKGELSEKAMIEFSLYTVKQDTGTSIINPCNISVYDINLEDNATALSGTNRFAGQTKEMYGSSKEFYSVGQHTLSMYEAIKNNPKSLNMGLEYDSQWYVKGLAKMALMHETPFEGTTGTDMITPLKYASKNGDYKRAEHKAEQIFEKVFGIPMMIPALKKIDKAMAATEGIYLVGTKNTRWENCGEILDRSLLCSNYSQKEVKEKLISAFEEEGMFQRLEDFKRKKYLNREKSINYKLKLESLQLSLKYITDEIPFDVPFTQVVEALALTQTDLRKINEEGLSLSLKTNKILEINSKGKILIKSDYEEENLNLSDFTSPLEIMQKIEEFSKHNFSYLDESLITKEAAGLNDDGSEITEQTTGMKIN